jgi:hypothetical protein
MQGFVPPTVLDRSLTADEDAALRWILWLEDFPGAEELRAQIGHVRATWGRTSEMDLAVTNAVPAAVSDGVLSVAALVVGADEMAEGLITVWVKGGYLSSLEYSWSTDSMDQAACVFFDSDVRITKETESALAKLAEVAHGELIHTQTAISRLGTPCP